MGPVAGGVPSREERATICGWEGSLAFGNFADHSGGTAADFHGSSPLPELANCEFQFKAPCDGLSMKVRTSYPFALSNWPGS